MTITELNIYLDTLKIRIIHDKNKENKLVHSIGQLIGLAFHDPKKYPREPVQFTDSGYKAMTEFDKQHVANMKVTTITKEDRERYVREHKR